MPPKRNPSPLLTVPELAKQLGISDQTVRRWVRSKRIPSRLNAQGWPVVRLEDVPAELIETSKRFSEARYPKPDPEPQADLRGEITWLRQQLERALSIIAKREGDHTGTDGV